jgi:hypothetical protein
MKFKANINAISTNLLMQLLKIYFEVETSYYMICMMKSVELFENIFKLVKVIKYHISLYIFN